MSTENNESDNDIKLLAEKIVHILQNAGITRAMGIPAFIEIICEFAAASELGDQLIEKMTRDISQLYGLKRSKRLLLPELLKDMGIEPSN